MGHKPRDSSVIVSFVLIILFIHYDLYYDRQTDCPYSCHTLVLVQMFSLLVSMFTIYFVTSQGTSWLTKNILLVLLQYSSCK